MHGEFEKKSEEFFKAHRDALSAASRMHAFENEELRNHAAKTYSNLASVAKKAESKFRKMGKKFDDMRKLAKKAGNDKAARWCSLAKDEAHGLAKDLEKSAKESSEAMHRIRKANEKILKSIEAIEKYKHASHEVNRSLGNRH